VTALRLGALAFVAGACSTPQLPSPSKPSESAVPQASAAPRAASVAEPHSRVAPEPLPDGCVTAVPSDLAPLGRLEAVGQACARGMGPLSPSPRVATLAPGASLTLPFSVADPSRCLRAAATGSAGIEELELSVVDRGDRVLGADRLPGTVALANPDGPICLAGAGEYRAVALAAKGHGEVALQVWQAQ